MRQALHIFRKDVRRLWPEISIVQATTAGLAFAAGPQTSWDTALSLLTYLLPVAWCALIARLVYSESPAADQPFWVTRPYSRTSLLAAKALFAAVFVNLPKFAADVVILRAYGFPILPEMGGLLWNQVLLASVVVLPVAALCTVTTGFVQLITAVVVIGLATAGWSMVIGGTGAGVPWFALEWTRSYSAGLVMVLAALSIITWQYLRRDTARSRFAAGGAVVSVYLVLAFLPWTAAFALQSRLCRQTVDVSRLQVGFDPEMKWAARSLVYRDGTVDVQIPLRIIGAPAPLQLKAEGITASIEGAGGEVWRSGQPPITLRSAGELNSLHASLDSAFYNRVKDHPVRIQGSLYLTLYGNARTAMLPIRDQAELLPAPGVGLCSATRTGRQIFLNCRSAFKTEPGIVTLDLIGRHRFVIGAPAERLQSLSYPRPISYCPFPSDGNLIPVTQFTQAAEIANSWASPTVIRTTAFEPVAHVRKDFQINGLRLADFEPAENRK